MEKGKTKYYIYPGRTTGWGGPMTVAPVVTPELTIEKVLVTEHRETPVFFDYLVSNNFFSQFKGKTHQDALVAGEDIDTVSGATISSRAITRAVRSGMEISAHELAGSLLLVTALGKNIYCSWLCPFGALQEMIAHTGGLQTSVPKWIQAWLKAAAKVITWLVIMVAFATGNAAHAAIEPFATLFGLKGTTVQWYLISLVIGGAFFIPRFWCRFFCPAGVCFTKAAGAALMTAPATLSMFSIYSFSPSG